MSQSEMQFEGYRPGSLAAVVRLHMDYYAPAWGFGLAFETKVAGEMAAFLARFDAARDLFLCARDAAGDIQGSVTIDAAEADSLGAHLRWYIVGAGGRGSGIGRQLLERAVAHCRARGYPSIYLTTFAGLDAARHLYESLGFRLIRELETDQWQGGVKEQHFSLTFLPNRP